MASQSTERAFPLGTDQSRKGVSPYSHDLFGLNHPGPHLDLGTTSDGSVSPNSTVREASTDPYNEKNLEADRENQDRRVSDMTSVDDKEVEKSKSHKDQEPKGNEKDVEAGNDKDDSEEKEEKDPNLVDWDGSDDKENPQNWPFMKKCIATASLSFTTFVITYASSTFSSANQYTAEQFGVSEEVMILGTSLFVLGFATGPIIWGPLSELYGRRIPLFTGFIIFAIFQIPVALATNLQTIMLCRYFGGFFGSSALAIIGGALADFWDPVQRGVAICFFAGATFLGPVFGPIIGSFVSQSYLGWRWTAWITLIMAGLFGTIGLIAYPESYAPLLLQQRAKRLRFKTKNWALHAKADEKEVNLKEIVEQYLGRPFKMLAQEPILILVTLYMSLIYGILYLFFEVYPIAFGQVRGWSPGLASLPFLAITIGVVMGASIIVWMTLTRYKRKLKESGGKPVPEERLPAMIIGGIIFPIGLFWFAWTSNPAIHWAPQVVSGIFVGAGILMVFMQGLNYIIDCFLVYSNSALAANTLARSLLGAGFPMFSLYMYQRLGVDWATTLLGCLAVVCLPFPIVFFIYGEKIRKMSKYAPTD